MKVLLIQPPFTILRTEEKKCHPPLGLAYLAAVLKGGHEVAVLDALAEGYRQETSLAGGYVRYGLSFPEITRKIKDFSPDVVAVSCLFSAQSQNAQAICALSKEINDRVITVVGGAHCSALPTEVLADKNVDFAVIGEGEDTFKELLGHLEQNKSFANIEGVGFRQGNRIKINPKTGYLENLDDLPFPSWEPFPLEKYFQINNPHGGPARRIPFLPVITSRGCPFQCIFCSVHNLWGRNYRKRSAANVLSELEYLVAKFGIKEVLFEDDNLTLDKGRAEDIFRGMIGRGLNLLWNVPNGLALQTLDNQLLELMRKSGCYGISLGIESGDNYILKEVVRKSIELAAVRPIIRKAKKLGLETTAFFVVGLPGENKSSLKNTFRFAESIGADNINFFFATPLPGTRLLKVCQEQKLITSTIDYTRLRSNYPTFATPYFSIEELYRIVRRQALKMHLVAFLRNPLLFLRKLGNKIMRDPRYFMRTEW